MKTTLGSMLAVLPLLAGANIVAVLAKVKQAQQQQIEALEAKLEE